jgi:hypothetical protein
MIDFGSGQKRNGRFFLSCFDSLRKLKQSWNKWIVAHCWIDIINERFSLPTQLKSAASDLNSAVGRCQRFAGIDAAGESDVLGMHRLPCFNRHSNEKRSRQTVCCVTSTMKLLQKPEGNTKWFRNIVGTVPEPSPQAQAQQCGQAANHPCLWDPHEEKDILSRCKSRRREEQKTTTILKQKKKHRTIRKHKQKHKSPQFRNLIPQLKLHWINLGGTQAMH